MALGPTSQGIRPAPRERILAMGTWGAGKSHALGSIASLAAKTGADSTIYVIDTDSAWERMLSTDFPDLTNITHIEVDEWPEYMDALATISGKVQADDWLAIDLIGPAWEAVQEYYINEIFGSDPGAFFLEARKKEQKMALDGWKDWQYINKLYRQFSARLPKVPCHLYLAAAADPVSTDTDSTEIRRDYGPIGWKPKGQKHTAHLVHTVLLMRQITQGKWTLTTVKDRGRPQLSDAPLTDFAQQYLVKVGGWHL